MNSLFTISKACQLRFILGKQGLYPGQRWQSMQGVLEAIHSGCVVQMDPLIEVARNHDLSHASTALLAGSHAK